MAQHYVSVLGPYKGKSLGTPALNNDNNTIWNIHERYLILIPEKKNKKEIKEAQHNKLSDAHLLKKFCPLHFLCKL